jgi:hypothetical protein
VCPPGRSKELVLRSREGGLNSSIKSLGNCRRHVWRRTRLYLFAYEVQIFQDNMPHRRNFTAPDRHDLGFLPRTVKVRSSGNSFIGKVALAAYFHSAHYNSPMALAAYFCRYPASRGISRAVPKVSESFTGGAARTDQLTRRPRLVFSRQPLWRVAGHTKFYCIIIYPNFPCPTVHFNLSP